MTRYVSENMSVKFKQAIRALCFAVSLLSAVHFGVFIWLSAFVYHESIRGHVSTGLSGLVRFAAAGMAVFLYLSFVAFRRKNFLYVLVGFLSPPVALIAASLFSSAGLAMLGYTFENDLIVSSVGCSACIGGAILFRVGPTRTSKSDASQ